MQMRIPEIGDEIRLTAAWHFALFPEGRNDTLVELLGIRDQIRAAEEQIDALVAHLSYWERVKKRREIETGVPVVIPAGTVLKVDRIYIRKGKGDFSSVTFMWPGKKIPKSVREVTYNFDGRPYTEIVRTSARTVRFWAKLNDVNNIFYEPLTKPA
jgi:hypothetical protein